jgi:hypothetical protein
LRVSVTPGNSAADPQMAHALTKYHRMSFDELSTLFDGMGVPTDQPGFYDHPELQKLERDGVDVLGAYGRFVNTRKYADEYIARVTPQIEAGAKKLSELLFSDGRLGACIDCSMSFSRMLDQLGIWNYTAKGALTLRFPRKSGMGVFNFWPIDVGNGHPGEYGHKWVFAPPFSVIDLTLKLQDYYRPFGKLLPPFVITQSAGEARAEVSDVLSPAAIDYSDRRGIPRANAYDAFDGGLQKRIDAFPAYSITVNGVDMKYVTCAVGASDCPLSEITSLTLSGRIAPVLFEEEIRPAMERDVSEGA